MARLVLAIHLPVFRNGLYVEAGFFRVMQGCVIIPAFSPLFLGFALIIFTDSYMIIG